MSARLAAFGAPRRYLQGPGAFGHLDAELTALGAKPFMVMDRAVASVAERQLGQGSSHWRLELFSGECSAEEISRNVTCAKAHAAGVVVGFGGGKAVDCAKGVALDLGLPIVVVPSIASTDAPTSRLIVVYGNDHVLSEVRLLRTNPDVVLVDTHIICAAPRRFLVAGIGDALSKSSETAQCVASRGTNLFGHSPTALSQTIADTCYRTLRAVSSQALEEHAKGVPGRAFESLVEATILLSGLGFENGGLSLAHAMIRGLSTLPSLSGYLHGELVAYALLVQWSLEAREPAEIVDLMGFCGSVGLPLDIGMKVVAADREQWDAIAWRTIEHPYARNFYKSISARDLHRAVSEVHELSNSSL